VASRPSKRPRGFKERTPRSVAVLIITNIIPSVPLPFSSSSSSSSSPSSLRLVAIHHRAAPPAHRSRLQNDHPPCGGLEAVGRIAIWIHFPPPPTRPGSISPPSCPPPLPVPSPNPYGTETLGPRSDGAFGSDSDAGRRGYGLGVFEFDFGGGGG